MMGPLVCKSPSMVFFWTAMNTLTIQYIFLLIVQPGTNIFSNASETNRSTTRRVRYREFLRGGNEPARRITTTSSTTTSQTTTEPTTTSVDLAAVEREYNMLKNYQRDYVSGPWSEPVSVNATANQTATLIFLHGIGDKGSGWAYSLAHIRRPFMKIICPTAKEMPISLNNKSMSKTPSWFNRRPDTLENQQDMNRSNKYIHRLIDEEIKNGIKSDRIVIGGFSQGAAMAIYSALSYPKKLGGLLIMSGWIPLGSEFFNYFNVINTDIPIFQSHGEKDTLVTFSAGNYTSKVLAEISNNTHFKSYPEADHLVNEVGMNDFKSFLHSCIKE